LASTGASAFSGTKTSMCRSTAAATVAAARAALPQLAIASRAGCSVPPFRVAQASRAASEVDGDAHDVPALEAAGDVAGLVLNEHCPAAASRRRVQLGVAAQRGLHEATAKALGLDRRQLVVDLTHQRHYPGRKTPKRAVKCHARPYKSTIERRFTVENAKGA
jgi:hypothetical protein